MSGFETENAESSQSTTIPIIRPDTNMSESMSSTMKRKLSVAALPRMKCTLRSLIMELIIWSISAVFALIHFFVPYKTYLLYSFGTLDLIVIVTWIYLEVDKHSFFLIMTSFRGFVITIATLTISICDISRELIASDTATLYQIIIDDLLWTAAVVVLVSSDCVPSITPFLRLIGPISAVINGINNLFIYAEATDVIIYQNDYGYMSLDMIERAATIELLLFGASFIFGVPRDWAHRYFVVLTKRVKIKKLLPLRDYATNARTYTFITRTIKVKTSHIWLITTIWSIFTTGIWILHIYVASTGVLYFCLIWNAVYVIFLSFIVPVLIWNHFDKAIIKHLFPQFRLSMLAVSIVILLFCAGQRLHWHGFGADELFKFTQTMLNIYCIIFMIGNDLLLVSYPKYMKIWTCVIMFVVSALSIYLLTFSPRVKIYPTWYLWLEREAYYQAMVLGVLVLWNIFVRDRESKYFVLITARRECKELFYDQNKLESLDNDLSYRLLLDDNEAIDQNL